MDPIAKYVERIVQDCPALGPDELKVIEACLKECFELGKEWEDVPILMQEAKLPPKRNDKKRNTS